MLHLGGGHALRVDVADFLELEGALERGGVVVAPPEEEPVVALDVLLRDVEDPLVEGEGALDVIGDLGEFLDHAARVLGAHDAPAGEPEAHHGEDRDLAHEGLGAGDADFWADAEVDAGVGLARDGRAHDVDHAQREGAAVADLAQGCEGVGGLARLADRDDDGAVLDDGVAVTEFAGVLALDRELGEVLEEVLADHAGVQGGPLGADDHAPGADELLLEALEPAQDDAALVEVEAPAQAVGQRAGLLVDLLLHVVLVVAQLDLAELQFELHDLGRELHVVDRARAQAVAGEADDRVVVEGHGAGGVGDDGGAVGGDDVLAVADAHDEGRALAGAHQGVRLAGAHDRDGVGAGDLAERRLHRGFEVEPLVGVVELGDQVREDLGVGLADAAAPLFLKVLPDRGVVLDDPVVDEADGARGVGVGVGVGVGDTPVRGPAGVAHAQGPVKGGLALEALLQVGDPAHGLADAERGVPGVDAPEDREARGVVPPVLHPLEALDDQFPAIPVPDVRHDPAHTSPALPPESRSDRGSDAIGGDARATSPAP